MRLMERDDNGAYKEELWERLLGEKPMDAPFPQCPDGKGRLAGMSASTPQHTDAFTPFPYSQSVIIGGSAHP